MTAGERIVIRRVREALCRPNMTLHDFRIQAVYAIPRREAKGIDAAIRRVAWEVHDMTIEQFHAKYGPRPKARKNP